MNVSAVTEEGATFNANLYSMGTETILNHGFVWGTYSEPELNSNRIYLGSSVIQGIFSAKINTTLQKDAEYFVRPFVQTSNHIVYGKSVSFKSLGSNAPSITGFQPDSAGWGDTLIVSGKNFSWSGRENIVKLNEIECNVIMSTDTLLKILINPEITSLKSILSVDLAGNSAVHLIDTFKLNPPLLYGIAPKEGTWGDVMTLTGKFNIITDRNKFYFDGILSQIISANPIEVRVKVPPDLFKPKTLIEYRIAPFQIFFTDTFRLKAPLIKSINPLTGAGETLVTIKGKYYSTIENGTKVYFGTTAANIVNINDSTIIVKAPTGITGQVKISVKSMQQSVDFQDEFNITNPVISSVTPLSGTFNDEVTIEGENFLLSAGTTSVSFNGIIASVIRLTATSLSVKVPTTMDSIPRTLIVQVGTNRIVSTEKFVLVPPEIYSLSSSEVVPSQDIRITGVNFNPDKTQVSVKWDIYSLKVISSTSNEIIATWPNSLPNGNYPLKIIIGGYTRNSTHFEYSTSAWNRIEAPSLSSGFSGGTFYDNMKILSVSLNGNGYLLSPASEKMYKYHQSPQTWEEIVTNYPFDKVQGMTALICRDSIYFISGYDMSGKQRTGVSLYNEGLNSWRKVAPTEILFGGYAFSLKNKIYLKNPNAYFYMSDPLNQYQWIQVANCPVYYYYISTYFSLNDKGYILYDNNELWMYDPDSDKWIKKSMFPGLPRRSAFSTVIGDYVYIGTGNSGPWGNIFSDIWKYSPATDTWNKISDIPIARGNATAFSINGKIYIGYGITKSGSTGIYELQDFYEFDPSGL